MIHLQRGRVLIIPNKPIDNVGGIWLPDTVQQERDTGLVVLIGDDVPKKFDKRQVLFNKMAKVPMVYEGIEAVLLNHYGDIIAILD